MVHYRVGSLETKSESSQTLIIVHYRVGSLEKQTNDKFLSPEVHCRVGSKIICIIFWIIIVILKKIVFYTK